MSGKPRFCARISGNSGNNRILIESRSAHVSDSHEGRRGMRAEREDVYIYKKKKKIEEEEQKMLIDRMESEIY